MANKIEFVDLKRQLYGDPIVGSKGIIDEITEAIEECVRNTSFTQGPILENFEKEFALFCNALYCVGLNSGTDALEFSLRCNGLTNGNVITVPNSYFTTSSSISQAGLTPKFVDIDPKTYTMDVNQLESAIDKDTKAILPVHFYGQPCNMDKIMEIAKKHNLLVIEDCAHAHGTIYHGNPVPISGTGAFSFFPGKNMGAWGDAGALVTNDPEVVKQTLFWRNDGSIKKYYHEILGRKARLHTLQASILTVKLKYVLQWAKLRREHAALYNKLLQDVNEIQLPALGDEQSKPAFHIYNILTERREELQKFLNEKGIATNIHYPIPIHLQPAYAFLGLKEGSFPVAENFTKTTLSLPMFPELRNDEIEYVCTAIKEFFNKN